MNTSSHASLRLGLSKTHSRGYLPHVEGARYQVVTYRLGDALPKKALDQMKERYGYWEKGRQAAGGPGDGDVSRQAAGGPGDVNGAPAARRHHDRVDSSRSQRAAGGPDSGRGSEELNRAIDRYLDAGYGACLLRESESARVIVENWFHFHGKRYEILAFVVMPNHVHILLNVHQGFSLGKIVQSWKSYSAKKILENEEHQVSLERNRGEAGKLPADRDRRDVNGNESRMDASGPLAVRMQVQHVASGPLPVPGGRKVWQREYRDRFIRDYEHLMTCIRYIHQNPVKAGLVDRDHDHDWEWSSVHANWKDMVSPINAKDWIGA